MRHGLSIMNKQGIFAGSIDTPLSKEGVQQCLLAVKDLSDIKIDAIVSSPMKRALDSAKIIAEQINYPIDKIIINDLFVERNFGPIEGTKYFPNMNLDDTHGVEHSNSVILRAQKGLDFINSLQAQNVLVVSHGALGRALIYAINPSVDFSSIKSFNNAEIIKLI